MAEMELASLAMMVLGLALGGAVMGVLAGLFGVGGGAISVPILFELFRITGIDADLAMPMAVGTSLAIILPTSIRSAIGHWRKGAVDLGVLKSWIVPVLVGVLLGSAVARFAPAEVFQAVFVLVATTNATKLLLGRESWRIADALPKGAMLWFYGWITGLLSSLMGIGGGAIANMIFTLHGRSIHQAVATSAGVGVLIAIPGTIGYILAGWGREGLPSDAIGFVSLLGLVLFLPTTLLTTQIGVNLSHSLSKRRLEVAFGLFLSLVSARFIYALASG